MSTSGGAGGALTSVVSDIVADVALGNNAATLITSVNLTAGTWLIQAKATITSGANAGTVYVWVGTGNATTAGAVASGGDTLPANEQASVPVAPAVVVLAAAVTYYLNALLGVAGGTAKAADLGPVGTVATQLVALKIA